MIQENLVHFSLSDNKKTRYSIPEHAVKKVKGDGKSKLEKAGFSYNLDPFSIAFSDPTNNVGSYLTTHEQSFVFMDKFI